MSYTNKKQLVKLISYMATFDGGLYQYGSQKDARFIMNMREENLDYLEWVYSTLIEVTSATLKKRPDYNTDGYKRAKQMRISSSQHSFFTKIKDRIYIDNHKVIDPHMLKLMDAEALAIIFMCDGGSYLDTRFKNPHANISLHTKGFSHQDNMALSKTIYDKLGIITTVNRHSKYYFLRVKTKSIQLFVDTILPYVSPSFLYKIQRLAPVLTLDDDIVWPSQQCEEGMGDHTPL